MNDSPPTKFRQQAYADFARFLAEVNLTSHAHQIQGCSIANLATLALFDLFSEEDPLPLTRTFGLCLEKRLVLETHNYGLLALRAAPSQPPLNAFGQPLGSVENLQGFEKLPVSSWGADEYASYLRSSPSYQAARALVKSRLISLATPAISLRKRDRRL